MQLDISLLTTKASDYFDVDLWVCDYRVPDINKKAIRNVKPAKARLKVAGEGERIYYSETYFVPVDGKKTIIKLFDNTGYRSFTGVPLKVFTTESECREFFAAQCLTVESELQKEIDTVIANLTEQKAAVEKMRKENMK